jgi:adenine C2-methylase RlmN of 23S rRNA A2503 and tRNA A37
MIAGKRESAKDSRYRRPSVKDAAFANGWRAAELTRYLHRRGVLAKVRRSAGQDVEAGCGQLRARRPALADAAAASV